MYAHTSLTLFSYCGVHAVFPLCVVYLSRACIPCIDCRNKSKGNGVWLKVDLQSHGETRKRSRKFLPFCCLHCNRLSFGCNLVTFHLPHRENGVKFKLECSVWVFCDFSRPFEPNVGSKINHKLIRTTAWKLNSKTCSPSETWRKRG
jgi:hypothetical protein